MFKLGVTCYSYQDEIKLGRMTWEDVFAHVQSIGAEGFEIVPEQFMTDVQYETIPHDYVAWWKDMVQKYNLTPTNCNLYDDYDVYPNRILNIDERFERMQHGIRLAKTLGFKTVRACADIPIPLSERVLKEAEYNGITLSLEIHAPYSLKSTWTQDWFDMIERTGTKFAGIHPDGGIFSMGLRRGAMAQAVRRGANPEILEFINAEYPKYKARRAANCELLDMRDYHSAYGYGAQEMSEKVREMGGGDLEIGVFNRFTCDDPAWIVEYAKYIVHFHGKFYDMVDDGEGGFYDPSIDYKGIVKALRDCGYSGSFSTEYEGMGAYHDFGCTDPVPDAKDMISKQHSMIRKYIETV